MIDAPDLIGFVAASLVVLLFPGPGVVYVVARSVSQGQIAGFVSVAGLSTGAFVHVLAAALGLSAILLTSAMAFSVLKIVGAAYLIYLGVQALLSRHKTQQVDASAPRSFKKLFIDGALVSVLNPKIAVFFLAYLPQFVDPANGSVTRQILFLGLVYVALSLVTDGAYAILGARSSNLLKRIRNSGTRLQYASGSVYIGLGIYLLAEDRP